MFHGEKGRIDSFPPSPVCGAFLKAKALQIRRPLLWSVAAHMLKAHRSNFCCYTIGSARNVEICTIPWSLILLYHVSVTVRAYAWKPLTFFRDRSSGRHIPIVINTEVFNNPIVQKLNQPTSSINLLQGKTLFLIIQSHALSSLIFVLVWETK